ncbi:hypothetical protein K0M31_019416 [Melipona bicolor]|uniref:Uncharacterized protein n=1 Tax=Melipona bicolor TaxID=60889 RepID=A0AA40G282_9HYME|nr:hypothetical protein K0M31_019416 [Melipona bicolor]
MKTLPQATVAAAWLVEIKRRFTFWDQCRHVCPTYTYKSTVVVGVPDLETVDRGYSSEHDRAVPGMPEASGLPGTPYTSADITKDVEMVSLLLPGSENLDEKSIPLSKLAGDHSFPLAGLNLLETTPTEIVVKLPGTKNLAEKRIPDPVLQKLYQRYQVD